MSYEFYKVLHLFGLFMVFSALGAQLMQALNGNDPKQLPGRRWAAILHGVGLLIAFVAGFGLIAKMQIGFPVWVILKMVIWLVLGGISAVAVRKNNLAGMIWVLVLALGMAATYLARYKPMFM